MNDFFSSAVLWLATQTVARQVISFALFVLLGRMLGPADFGTIGLCMAVILILQAFSSRGITQAVIQKPNLTDDEASTAYSLVLLVSIAIALLIVSAAGVFSYSSKDQPDTFPLVLSALALTLPYSALYEVHQARLMRDFQFGLVAKKALAAQIMGGVVAVICAFAGLGVWSLVVQQFVALSIELLIVRQASKWKAKFLLERNLVSDISKFGAHLFGANILGIVDMRGADLIIGTFYGSLSVGYFRIARSTFEIFVSVFATPLQSVSLPLFSSKQGVVSEARQSFLRMTEALAWLSLPPFLVLIVWGPTFMTTLLGAKWIDSGWILQILSLQVFVYGAFFLYDPLLVGLGKTRDLLSLRFWQTGINLSIMLAAAPFGFGQIIFAQVVGLFLTAPIMFIYVSRAAKLNFTDLLSTLWKPYVFGLAFAILAYLFEAYVLGGLGLIGLIGALTISYCLFFASFLYFATPELSAKTIGIFKVFLRTRRI